MSVLQHVTIPPDQPACTASCRKADLRLALVLGTGDIASATARDVFPAGWAVVMLRDPGTPVLRRGMAFDDAQEDERAEIDGVTGTKAAEPAELADFALRRDGVVLANLDLRPPDRRQIERRSRRGSRPYRPCRSARARQGADGVGRRRGRQPRR